MTDIYKCTNLSYLDSQRIDSQRIVRSGDDSTIDCLFERRSFHHDRFPKKDQDNCSMVFPLVNFANVQLFLSKTGPIHSTRNNSRENHVWPFWHLAWKIHFGKLTHCLFNKKHACTEGKILKGNDKWIEQARVLLSSSYDHSGMSTWCM